MKFFTRFVWACKTLVFPLVATLMIVTLLFFSGHRQAALFASYGLTAIIFIANLVYLGFFGDRKPQLAKIPIDSRRAKRPNN